MEENNALEKTLQEILACEDFDRLMPYAESACWTAMSANERDLLAMLFTAQGERLLNDGAPNAFNNFEIASKISPKSKAILYRKAMAYATQKENIGCLNAACTAFQEVVTLEPNFFDAWVSWGNTLVRLGIFGETNYFQEAHQKFLKAEACAAAINQAKLAETYWHWGVCWHFHGQQSGEACDFYMALEKYAQAAELGFNSVDFWNDYGDAVVELAGLIGRKELLFEAVDIYKDAIRIDPNRYQSWFNLGCCFQRIFEYNHDEDFFTFANDSFARAEDLDEKAFELWLNWGQLFVDFGKCKHDIEHLQVSFEKFAKADACEPNHSVVLRHWGEALMLYGSYTEKGEVLREAEAKIVRSIEIHPEHPDSWYLYGCCLNELGRYFIEETFFVKAIEKYRYGISLDKNNPLFFYGMSLAYLSIGELSADSDMIEQAIQCYPRVLELGGQTYPQFWNDWGVALMKLAELTNDQKSVEAAIEKFECAINQHAQSNSKVACEVEWLYNYGCALDFLGDFTQNSSDYEKAVHVLAKALEQDPSYVHSRYNLALALSHLGELNDDIECFYKSIELFELLLADDAEDEMAWNHWGLTLLHLAQLIMDSLHPEQGLQLYEEAERKLTHAVALGCTEAFYNLACLHALRANYAVAMHYIERAEVSGALPGVEDLMHDEWLVGLRDTQNFQSFIALLSNKYEKEKQ
jgi:tetratricopeptide (TPR) repeat protein